jgi:hypothetical protein
MASNGVTLHTQSVTTAEAAQTSTAVAIPTNISNVVLQAVFTYGSGGTSADYYVQTTFDGGTSWVDIAQFSFTTASAKKVFALTRTSITTSYAPLDGTMTANTCKDGLIGDQLRVKRTTVGTYAATTIVVTAFLASDVGK